MPVWNRPMNKKVRKIAALAWQQAIKDSWFPDPPRPVHDCPQCGWAMAENEDSIGVFYVCQVCGHVHDPLREPVLVQDWD